MPDCINVSVVTIGTVNAMTGQTIHYTYDPLDRLTAADYTDGRFFHYIYDPVGNRLSQNSKTDPITDPVTKTYTYDSANRLTGVNGASYTWDNNGNLLNDGTSSYEYDPLNHLTQLVNGNNTYKFNYDAQGNRVGQAVNGAWTYYDLDLNGELSQVLTAQDEDYLYGLGLAAQNDPGDIEYLLTDGLGSVRQIVRGDSFGQVTLTRSYDPFGSTLTSAGSGASAFGYAGQWNDASGLMDMRARYYQPEDGRFLTEDSWQGDQNQPMSYNLWLYGYANPVLHTDNSGNRPDNGIMDLISKYINCSKASENITNDEIEKEIYKAENTKDDSQQAIYYQEAIIMTIMRYQIDTHNMRHGVLYSPDDADLGNSDGLTDADTTIHISESAFYELGDLFHIIVFGTKYASPGFLASVIIHEGVHANQIVQHRSHYQLPAGSYERSQMHALNEYEAYLVQLHKVIEFGLRSNTRQDIESQLHDYYNEMDDATKKLAEPWKNLEPKE